MPPLESLWDQNYWVYYPVKSTADRLRPKWPSAIRTGYVPCLYGEAVGGLLDCTQIFFLNIPSLASYQLIYQQLHTVYLQDTRLG